ncbi:DUF3992 domain-containing protein [Strepomyces sp. STD 3.1]|nr:DUF3992 domain-containing protein [Streptomyces sp. STD 3.1]
MNDSLCFTIDLGDTGGTPLPIWDDATNFVINGTIMVENNGIEDVGPTAALTVNGAAVGGFVVAPGEARSITLDNLNSIGITGAGGTGTSSVKVSFSLNYQF